MENKQDQGQSQDGAHHGMTAGQALGVVLGGDEPPAKEDRLQTQDEMRAFLENGTADDPYSEGARQTGAIILAFLDEHPNLKHLNAEDSYELTEDRNGIRYTALGLSGVLRVAGVKLPEGLSGFMFGWAVNAAKYAAGAPPVANPAILEINL